MVTIAIARLVHRLALAFLVLDAVGLVVFTIAGCDVAWQIHASFPIVIVAGMITGCAGGVLRDILCNDVPLLFRSELHASVSVVTRAHIPVRVDIPPARDPLRFVFAGEQR